MKNKIKEIIKPSIDERNYRFIILENNLPILLISDPKTEKVI